MFFEYLQNYLTILIFLFVAIGIGIAFIVVNFLCAPSKPDAEKLSAYECGFEPFGDSRMKFDVRFYLVSILFIIFDLGDCISFSLGNYFRSNWFVRFLVNDDFHWHVNSWIYL